MYYTISLNLNLDAAQSERLLLLQSAYADACNMLVPHVIKDRNWNRVSLHQRSYSELRSQSPLGSQMVCNAIFSVCKAYRSQKALGRIQKEKPVPRLCFNKASVHYDKRTYSFKGGELSLNTLSGRIRVSYCLGEHQLKIFERGNPKEAELIHRKGRWYFNLVLELPEVPKVASDVVLGVNTNKEAALGFKTSRQTLRDCASEMPKFLNRELLGENNLAATSTGKLFGGGNLRESRDRYLSYRGRLQSNGSQSARQKLCQVSGKERRRVTHVNHETSKAIVQEAQELGAGLIVLEDLTHIRSNIKARKRVRTRLHRWAFRQLQTFVECKAKALGIDVLYVDPAYTSQTCSSCLDLGKRERHLFKCTCGFRAHADCNASRNLARIGKTAVLPRAAVSRPNVGLVH